MAMDPMSAAAAYRANAGGDRVFKTGTTAEDTASSGSSFVDLVRGAAKDAIDANHRAEDLSAKAMAGQATVTEVVTALAEAESTLNTVVTVRDRVISAYQEILRMPI
ncbi:flagellar hook-basal body protein FliE [Rhodospirillaceae bacterium KN72]|uniref:Flagellar hook-basal body complex protein FliE n=1 Tax=Pacificispira spongiicola TaxID=2729598 RepID=A0A7Y0HI97_9PROT|nr:flagellar hook-basal body complex protein FliE [Pacificispira spongiicola]NMM46299.1 flagellar hook-basal body protein FliE [Pacificispira spongiicola]